MAKHTFVATIEEVNARFVACGDMKSSTTIQCALLDLK